MFLYQIQIQFKLCMNFLLLCCFIQYCKHIFLSTTVALQKSVSIGILCQVGRPSSKYLLKLLRNFLFQFLNSVCVVLFCCIYDTFSFWSVFYLMDYTIFVIDWILMQCWYISNCFSYLLYWKLTHLFVNLNDEICEWFGDIF